MNKRFNRGDKPERGGDKSRYSGKKTNDRRDSDKKPRGTGRFNREDSDNDSKRSYSGPKRNLTDKSRDNSSYDRNKKPVRRGNSGFRKEEGSSDRRFSKDGDKRYSRDNREEKGNYDNREKRFSRGDRDEKRPYNKGEKRYSRGDRDEKSGFERKDRRFKDSGRDDKDRRFKDSRRDDKDSKRPDKRFSRDEKSDRRDYKSDRPEDKKRPRTRKLNEKDQEMLGDWRRERPQSEFHKKSDKSKEIVSITEEVRLNKYLANSGLCSRRDADDYILNGAVTINGEEAKELGTRVQPGDEVRFKGRLILPEKPVYILMNKPKDCITSADDPEGRRTVLDIIGDHIPQRIFPVGRLDRNTTGVLLLTNDGDLSQKLTHPSFGVHKIYKAELNKQMPKADLEKLAAGVELEDGFIKPDEVAYVDESRTVVGIEIHSGKNHIVHRMFNSLGYLIEKLDRVTFAGLSKDGLKRGDIRHLTEKELMTLRKESGKKK